MSFLSDSKEVIAVWKRIFTKTKYLAAGIIIAVAFYLVNGFIVARPDATKFFEAYGGLFGALKILEATAVYSHKLLANTFFGIIVLSILVGMLGGLLWYRFDNFYSVRGGNWIAAAGVFLGMAAPGCAACGVGLLSFLGIGSVIAILPYRGLEVLIAAVALTGISITLISKKLYNPVCEIKDNKKNSLKLNNLKGGKKNE